MDVEPTVKTVVSRGELFRRRPEVREERKASLEKVFSKMTTRYGEEENKGFGD
ncbi:unnamed protein product [Eruca vesicaria subsp. sativa]|uniref:Uncharacterized protein n=1 Tax=Eruca vesicaria subsp. sativa TaxID=29727 RepID=A0ABC8K0G2_ERUVS|nr:unnamed protein product [Eruca vesicaria subsp. sativa]